MPTIKDLCAECKSKNLKGYSKLTKKELIKLLGDMKKNNDVEKKFEIGMHVGKKGDMAVSIAKAIADLKLTAVQIFTHGPRNQRASKMDYKSVKEACSKIHLYVHSSYPTNPWNGKAVIFEHTIDQFRTAAIIGAIGVVLHIPKILPEAVAATTKLIVARLKKERINVKVILEMKAVIPGVMSYESPEKIDALINELIRLDLTPQDTVICIDTAHIYAGKAQIQSYSDAIAYLDDLKNPEWIGLIHLNGNEYDAKKRAGDKHAVPFDSTDKIWKNMAYTDSGCKAFVEWAMEKRIDYILEIKDHHTHGAVQKFIKYMA